MLKCLQYFLLGMGLGGPIGTFIILCNLGTPKSTFMIVNALQWVSLIIGIGIGVYREHKESSYEV